MVRGGLSSVSYRNSAPEAVIAAAVGAGLGGIEWTADTHVPHGNLQRAEGMMIATLRAGLTISAYGSFYRLDRDPATFPTVLETARRLQAPVIRVWGGSPGAELATLAAAGAAVADQAGKHGITICLEPNERTAVPDFPTLEKVLDRANHPFLRACWTTLDSAEEGTPIPETLCARIALAHIRNWFPKPGMDWHGRGYLAVLKRLAEHHRSSALDRWALIEYLEDDRPETLKRNAVALVAELKV